MVRFNFSLLLGRYIFEIELYVFMKKKSILIVVCMYVIWNFVLLVNYVLMGGVLK